MATRYLMVQGVGPGVGKSLVATALCRIFADKGLRVVPFQAQNVTHGTTVAAPGREIALAQALQARAAGVEPDARMSPIVLRPRGRDSHPPHDPLVEFLFCGELNGITSERLYTCCRERLAGLVREPLREVAEGADLVVIEGCGSPLLQGLDGSDFANFALAAELDAPVLWVAEPEGESGPAAVRALWSDLMYGGDRRHVVGVILNRRDPEGGGPASEELPVPLVGVVPHVRHLLPRERGAADGASTGGIPVAVLRLPHLSRSDDVDPLIGEPGLEVRWVERPEELRESAAVVIPGSRNAPRDLVWLWESGFAPVLRELAGSGRPVVGLGEGYLVMGKRFPDSRAEGGGRMLRGLELLDFEVEMASEDVIGWRSMRVVAAEGPLAPLHGHAVRGCAIQCVLVRTGEGARVWLEADAALPGCGSGSTWGTPLHGVFADDRLRGAWVRSLGATPIPTGWETREENDLAALASSVAASLDLSWIESVMENFPRSGYSFSTCTIGPGAAAD
jgi:adenosylcobyric acid synthase